MRIVTNHEDGYAQMACGTCLVETRVSTFSTIFETMIAFFSTMHASCSTTGRPELEAAVQDFLAHRSRHPTHQSFDFLFPAVNDPEGSPRLSVVTPMP